MTRIASLALVQSSARRTWRSRQGWWRTGRVLLRDQLIAKKMLFPGDPATRAVYPESAFRAIEEAYEELRDQRLNHSEIPGRLGIGQPSVRPILTDG